MQISFTILIINYLYHSVLFSTIQYFKYGIECSSKKGEQTKTCNDGQQNEENVSAMFQ